MLISFYTEELKSKQTQQILEGMAIILKYQPGAGIHPEHDMIYFGNYETSEKMTDEEKRVLDSLGWFNENDGWAHYAST